MYIATLLAALTLWINGNPLHVEEAVTQEEHVWGLMGRESLGDDEGMLFVYPFPQNISVWMFNCLIDLDVAFLDEDFNIIEIHEMKAYPEIMDPNRPIKTINDTRLYPRNDPIRKFFHDKGVTSSFKAKYMLELRGGWFRDKEINSLPFNVKREYVNQVKKEFNYGD